MKQGLVQLQSLVRLVWLWRDKDSTRSHHLVHPLGEETQGTNFMLET